MNNLNIFNNNKNLEEKSYTYTFYKNNPNDVKSITDFIDVNSTDNYISALKNDKKKVEVLVRKNYLIYIIQIKM